MKIALGKSCSLRQSSRRVAIIVVVTGCHLGLPMLLRPVLFSRAAPPAAGNRLQAIELHFFRPAQPSSPHPRLPPQPLIAPVTQSRQTRSTRSLELPVAPPLERADARPHAPSSTRAENPETSTENTLDDGGFQERLRKSQGAYAVHGVPGSDTPVAPGIHLVDPMSQGIGAVMRTTQRAFGIANSHCIDVDVWRHLTPRQLSARHISPDEVNKVDQKYDCNRPPGLSF